MKNYLKAIGLSVLMTANLMADTLVKPVTIDNNGQKYLGKVEYTEGKDKSTMRISEGNSYADFVDDKNDGTIDYFNFRSVRGPVTFDMEIYRKDMGSMEEFLDGLYDMFKKGMRDDKPLKIKLDIRMPNYTPTEEPQSEIKTFEL